MSKILCISIAIPTNSVLLPPPAERAGRFSTSLKRAKAMSESTIDPTEYRLHDNDTGSADYQVALLSQRIKHLTDHLGTHRKDFSSRRGLLTLVARRRKLLDFLQRDNEERYKKIVAGLGLRR